MTAHKTVEFRLDVETAAFVERVAANSDVTTDQAASVIANMALMRYVATAKAHAPAPDSTGNDGEQTRPSSPGAGAQTKFEEYWNAHKRKSWADMGDPPEIWGSGLRPYAKEGWDAAIAALQQPSGRKPIAWIVDSPIYGQCFSFSNEFLAYFPNSPADMTPVPVSADRHAYEGAREDLLDWKGRALRAEVRLRALGYTGVDASEPPGQQPIGEIAREWFENQLDGLNSETAGLVWNFALALGNKLRDAERKYGYSDGWRSKEWMDGCRAELVKHVAKGDPRDVAAYCAFLWYHGQSTAPRKSLIGLRVECEARSSADSQSTIPNPPEVQP